MSSVPLHPANEQGGVGNSKIASNGKDGKGTLTDLWKKKQENAEPATQEPEEIDLVSEAPETEDPHAEDAMVEVTPVAPEVKDAAQSTEDDTKMEVDNPAEDPVIPAAEATEVSFQMMVARSLIMASFFPS